MLNFLWILSFLLLFFLQNFYSFWLAQNHPSTLTPPPPFLLYFFVVVCTSKVIRLGNDCFYPPVIRNLSVAATLIMHLTSFLLNNRAPHFLYCYGVLKVFKSLTIYFNFRLNNAFMNSIGIFIWRSYQQRYGLLATF